MARDLDRIIEEMTLEEKASLCSGADLWHTKKVDRLGIPDIKVSDGPHGMRTQDDKADHLGINESLKAVCFPPAVLSACSFDRELLRKEGEAIGSEAAAYGVSTVLGPGVNMKRSPLCGRNFEYFSEDPYLAGELAAAFVEGVQSNGVGTSLKHFAANSQETYRMSNNSVIDERTLREIYLAAFEKVVKKAKPTTLMCSYNRINGEYAADNKWLLTEVLRDEWGFDGIVISDWNAVNDRVKGIEAGLDLEMPSSNGANDREIVKAVREGRLDEKKLDVVVKRLLKTIYDYKDNEPKAEIDFEEDHDIALQVAEQSMVLLKNDDNVLPLSEDEKVLFLGEYFVKPRYQGGGSSHINSFWVVSAEETVEEGYKSYAYSKGFSGSRDELDEDSFEMLLEVAKEMDKVVIFAGLPESFESEGYDRTHMRLPDSQNRMIREMAKVQENVVVVLHNGSPVEMPWVNDVKAILETYLGGEGSGQVAANILYGIVNPSGKLAETFPLRLEDNPSYLDFGSEEETIYREGLFIGYRYYDKRNMDVLFPFGHGLSYTKFKYSNLSIDKPVVKDDEELTVSFDVTNVGDRPGREAVQLYVSDENGVVIRPEKELKGFEKLFLKKGETKRVHIKLDKRSFAWYSTALHDWYAETGEYMILVGASSRDIRLVSTVRFETEAELPFVVDLNTTIGALKKHPSYFEKAADLVKVVEDVFGLEKAREEAAAKKGAKTKNNLEMLEAMVSVTPLRNVFMFGGMTRDELLKKIDEINKK